MKKVVMLSNKDLKKINKEITDGLEMVNRMSNMNINVDVLSKNLTEAELNKLTELNYGLDYIYDCFINLSKLTGVAVKIDG